MKSDRCLSVAPAFGTTDFSLFDVVDDADVVDRREEDETVTVALAPAP